MERRTGQTTRLADKYIQQLFTKGSIKVQDHFASHPSNSRLLGIIIKRLFDEHFHGGQRDALIINEGLKQISIKDFSAAEQKLKIEYKVKSFQQLKETFSETLSPFKRWVCEKLKITPSLRSAFTVEITLDEETEKNFRGCVVLFGGITWIVTSQTMTTLVIENVSPVYGWVGGTELIVISSNYAE